MKVEVFVRAIEWKEGAVRFLDQSRLPEEEVYIVTSDYNVIADAIKRLAIRGAPLIGIAAAYGVALAAQKISSPEPTSIHSSLEKAINALSSTRPTAVNLFWALERQRNVVRRKAEGPLSVLASSLLEEARRIHEEDREMCGRIGLHGASIVPNGALILTHCNTGSLATGGTGTAQSVIVSAWEQRKLRHVYIDETRPLLQGARLTAWELSKLKIPATLITDNTAAFLMQRGLITMVIVGADRIALNGDVANKVGTYSLAVLAKHHGIPMYVAAPTSSLDFSITHGKDIPLEQRDAREVTEIKGVKIAPAGTDVYSPAFDVTPHELVSAIITEEGIVRPPLPEGLEALRNALTEKHSASVLP